MSRRRGRERGAHLPAPDDRILLELERPNGGKLRVVGREGHVVLLVAQLGETPGEYVWSARAGLRLTVAEATAIGRHFVPARPSSRPWGSFEASPGKPSRRSLQRLHPSDGREVERDAEDAGGARRGPR